MYYAATHQEKLDNDQYDIALVDIQLSNGNGFSVCSAIKERGTMPVIFLTASDDEYSVVAGLDMGADDYISKPFRPRELLSRINSVLRRTKNTQNIISYHDLVVDTNQATVVKNGTEILLSAMEYKLLLVFLRNKGIVLSRRRLLELLWTMFCVFLVLLNTLLILERSSLGLNGLLI